MLIPFPQPASRRPRELHLKFAGANHDALNRRPRSVIIAFDLEVKAIDPDTGLPVASLPIKRMATWLQNEGYRWRTGSSGIWERAS